MELGDEALVVDGHGQINLMGFEDHKQNYWDNKSNNFNPQKAKKSDLWTTYELQLDYARIHTPYGL